MDATQSRMPASPPPVAAGEEWRRHWPLVMASMAGLSMSAVAAPSIGLFMEPLSREFGWSRALISIGLSIYALVAVPLSPLGGMLVDRWGSRRLAIPGVMLTSAAIALFSTANGSAAQWIALWLFYAFVAVAVKPTVWSAAVTSMFTTGRGLALGLTLCGNALAQMLVPVLTQHLIASYGWRDAYLLTGVGWGLVVLVLVLPFFFDAHDRGRQQATSPDAAKSRSELAGLTPRQALRSTVLIRIALATLIGTAAFGALTIHFVPILCERGLSRETAALLAALNGGMGIVGKLATGWIHDRWNRGWINALTLWAPILACLLLLVPDAPLPLVAAAVAVVGYCAGAVLQVCAYLTGRYGGIRNFGTIFGTMTSVLALGIGLGPLIAGLSYDSAGSYAPLLVGSMPALAIGGVLLLALGDYPDWTKSI